MNLSLYNEFRPSTFDDVVGQEAAVTVLRKEVMEHKCSNSMLLYGHHGTGKTSIARIIAKAVNCEHPVNGNPCGVCASCKSIDSESCPDIVEIDGASNNSVDNVRSLIQQARYAPLILNYRVFIIDEVHQLSIGAFNALLKTLEEPPATTIFILCTTEYYKIPHTIQSRCERFLFTPLSEDMICSRLQYITEQKNVPISQEGLRMIACAGNGALRDSLTLLEQCINSGVTTAEEVERFIGILPEQSIFKMLNCYASGDMASVWSLFNSLSNQQITSRIIKERMLDILVERIGYLANPDSLSEDRATLISALSLDKGVCLQLFKQLTNTRHEDLRLVMIGAMTEAAIYKETIGRIEALEQKMSSLSSSRPASVIDAPAEENDLATTEDPIIEPAKPEEDIRPDSDAIPDGFAESDEECPFEEEEDYSAIEEAQDVPHAPAEAQTAPADVFDMFNSAFPF